MAEQIPSEKSFPIVGIGASAGGLDALQRFLSILPQDFGFALVFIQHLSSKHKSLLPELLAARRPSLVIQEISDGLKAQPGRLYLSPPGREIRLRNGLFQTTVHPEGLLHLPIDEFLSSLAEDADGRSIAVIFSGAGTDGARGCQAVRTAGGTVFVQDPETAEFSSMPLAAIATGQADAVLSPEDICRELLKVQGIGTAAASREPAIAPEEYDTFFRILLDKTRGRFKHYKKSVVGRRIKRRMYLHGLSSVKDYLDLISARDAEAALLASDLMIGVTSFFRDRVAWKALSLEAVRKIVAENTGLPIRVWTPASATGEEAYSIAMMLFRELNLAGKKRDIQVFATDVNDRALERAREGKYPASISADVQQEYIQKYFTSTGDGNCLIINKEVRESVVFARQDLLTDPPFSKLDLIICRNFMIYLEPEAQEKCIRLFHYALNNGGFLFLGNAETVGRNNKLFQSIGRKQCRVYRKLETKPASRLPVSVPYVTERQALPAKQAQMTEQGRPVMDIIQEKLLEGYGPVSVAIDQNYEIVYHNGPTNRYLRQPRGGPTQNLLELLPESLRSRIRGALYRSGREDRPVAIRTNMAGEDIKKRQLTLRITKAAENLYIVVFQEKASPLKEEAADQVDAAVIEETAIHQLESELAATRSDLQSHIEQLKSLNEELQSSNEELQAANEELETSREELQSLNEELITVNSQLQGKIEEQDVTNNDLNNFLASTNIPTIFLDTHLRVKRFTPAMLRLIKLLPSDVGRPIVDMSQENLGPDLTSDAQSVLDQLVPLRQELTINSSWYVRTILPYRTADNRIEGVVVTYNDVTELKLAEERTRHLASFPQFNPNPVLEVNSAGAVAYTNAATQRVLEGLGLNKDDVAVFLPHDIDGILGDLEKNVEETLIREVTVADRVFEETIYVSPRFLTVRIYSFDVTERKKAEEVQGRLAAIVENAEDAIIGKDLDGIIQTWNVGAENIFGYKEEEVIGKNISLLVPPKHTDEVPEILTRIRQGEHIENFETVRMRKDGTIIPVSLMFSAIKDASGKVIGASKIAHDITERKRAEEALRWSEKQYRELFENMIEGYAYCKMVFENGKPQDFIYLSVNHAFEALTGLTNVVGKSVTEVIPGIREDDRELFEIYGRVALTGKPERFETFVEALKMWFSISVYSPQKEFFVAIFDVITERKQAEEELHLSEEKFSLAFANNPAAIALTRLEDGMFLDVNDTWLSMNGYRRDEVIGLSARRLPIWPTVEAGARFAQALREKVSLRGWEQEFHRKSGEVFVAQLSAQVLTVRGDKVVLSTLVDITDRKRAEESLLRLNKALKALSDSSQAMIRATDEPEYLNDVCRIIIEDCGYSMAWIGFAENDETKSVRTAAYAGFEDGYLETLKLSWADTERGRGPTGTAIRTGEVVVCRNMLTDPAFAPWREQALKRGYASSIVFPIMTARKTSGAITIYSREADPFSEDEIKLLTELADNLAHGINVLRLRAAQKKAEEALRESEEQFRSLADSIPNLAWWANADGYIIWYNRRWYDYTGTTPEQMEGWGWQSVHDPLVLPKVLERWKASIATGELFDMEFPLRGADGLFRSFLTRVLPLKDSAGSVIRWFGTNTDISALKRVEEALRESEARFRLALRNSPVSVAIQDNNLVYQWAYNQRTRRPDEVVGQTDADLFAPEDLPPILEAKRRVLESGIEEHTSMWLTRNGRRLFFDLYYEPMRDASGNITGVGIATVNLTDQKLAEEALTASEAKYRSLFENMIDGLAYHRIVTDESGKPVDYVFLEVNEAFEKQTGLKRADVIGKSAREALPGIENDPADWIGTYGKVALTGQEVRFQHYAAALGKWFSVSAYSPVKGYFVAIFEDVTESKTAEGALRDSEERFRSMFERHQAVMLLVEPESGAIVDANAAASRFYGYPPERLRAMRIQDINQLKPEDVAAERQLAAEEKRNHFIFPHLLSDGRVRWVEVYSTPFETQGRPLLFSIIHDITERKTAEADLLKLSEDMAARNLELESANKEMESFVYSISHDLRAPIRTVSGFAKIIVEDYLDKLDAQGRDYLNRILKGSEKSTQLIDDLLHLSKIARQDMDRIEVDLSSKASKVVEELREMNHGRNVEVVVQEGLTASADPRLIELALSNLLGNAWKFTSRTEQARIEFGSMEKDGETVYYVKDNGAGFDPAYADKMFWPFHRLHSENEFEGTGIGLTIVERVIRRHGGRVWAEGEVGKGATVYFTLG